MVQKQSQPIKRSKEDVVHLIKEFQITENKDILAELVEHYQALVESLARKYSKGRAYHEDIIQVGMIGLLGAIRRYELSYEKSFEAFAIPTIVGEIKRFLRDKTWSVHVPRRVKELGPKIKTAVEDLTLTLQRSPKVDEIANHLEVTEEEVLEVMEIGMSYQTLSVDHSIEADADGGTVTLLDLVGDLEDGYEKVDQRLMIESILHVLTEREKKVIEYTYVKNISQKETGEMLGISQMHVSRLQRRAIQKLRQAIKVESTSSECLS